MAGRLGPSLIRCVLSRFIRAKGAFVFIAITVIGTALSYAMPYVNGKFLDFLLGNRSERDAVLFALLVASIGVFSTLFTYFAGTLSIRITTRLSSDLLREAVLRFERDDYLVSRTIDPAYTTQRIISDSSVVSSFVLANFISAPLSIVAIPIVLLIIWSIDSTLAVFSIILLIVYFCVITGLRKLLYRVTYEKKEADSAFYAAIASQLNQILNIQLTSSYGKSEQALDAGFKSYFPKVLRSGKLSYSLTSLDGLFAALFQAVILVVSGVRIINGTMSIGEYTIIGTYFAVLFKTLKSMMSLFKSYQDAKASWDRTAIATREKERSGWNRTDLAKLDEINDISVSDLEFSVALPDGSVREVLGGFFFQVFRSWYILHSWGKRKRQDVTSLLDARAILIERQSKIQRRANRRMRLGLHTCERDIVLPTVVLRAGRNGERAVRVFRHALFFLSPGCRWPTFAGKQREGVARETLLRAFGR